MQLPCWKQNLALNPSLIDYNPDDLHQVYFTHLWDSWYSLQWLYSESSPTYDPENPSHAENHFCPEILHTICAHWPQNPDSFPGKNCWSRVTCRLPRAHGLVMIAQCVSRRSLSPLVSPQHCHFLALAPWSRWSKCPSMLCSSDCELWHMTERMLDLKGILKVILSSASQTFLLTTSEGKTHSSGYLPLQTRKQT